MREYILTEHERNVIEAYKKGEIKYGLYQIRARAKSCLPKLKKDVEMLESILE